MAFDASGTFSRTVGVVPGSPIWQGDAASGVKINAGRHDSHDQDLADGLSMCLLRNGAGVPTADIPWGGRKITNLATPTQPTDAATKDYVDKLPGWSTAKDISGADLDGRLNFTGTSGVNGITWTYADLSWVAKHAKASETQNRLVMNDSVTPSTTTNAGDVFFIDERGMVGNNGQITNNLSWDGTNWRAISPGFGSLLTYTGGDFSLSSNDVATITNNYATATLRTFFQALNSAGSSNVNLIKSASGKDCSLRGYTGAGSTGLRWNMQLGNATVESGVAVGSDFVLTGYNNTGTSLGARLVINRATGDATFAGDVYSAQQFNSKSTACIVSAANTGAIYFRPNGPTVTTEQSYIDTVGDFHVSHDIHAGQDGITLYGVYAGAGIREKAGSGGSYGDNWVNFNGTATSMHVYHGTTDLGLITWQCDYRMKRDVQPLGGMWDKVKALNPISYMPRKFGPFWDDGAERWGFLAHEMQEKLLPTAAEGEKDAEHQIQSLNLIAVVAALTKALQEAMLRIEALEAA